MAKSIDDVSPQEWTLANRKFLGVLDKEPDYCGDSDPVKPYDPVEKPKHYNSGKYETIDIIVDVLGKYEAISYCHGNVLKYTHRLWHKGNPVQDAKKAKWYLEKMIQLLEETKGTNW